jgi:hypothetical protein
VLTLAIRLIRTHFGAKKSPPKLGVIGDASVDHELQLRSALFTEEYRSLREESKQALTAQHVTLQWSLAAFAIILAAGLAIEGRLLNGGPPVTAAGGSGAAAGHGISYFIIFGFALPGLITAATMVWVGELYKMERVGCYLRAREKSLLKTGMESELGPAGALAKPLLWESYLALPNSRFQRPDGALGNSPIAFVGGMSVYAGGLLISLALYLSALWTDPFAPNSFWGRNQLEVLAAGTGYGLLFYLCFLIGFIRSARQLMYLSKRAARLDQVAPVPD